MAGPGGVEVGRAGVRVLPDTSKFREQLEAFLTKTENSLKLELPLEVKAQLDSARQAGIDAVRIAKAAAGNIDLQAAVDSTDLASTTRRAVESAQAVAGQIDIKMDIDPGAIMIDARHAVAAAQAVAGDVDVKMDIDTAGLMAKVFAATRQVALAAKAMAVEVKMKLDVKGLVSFIASSTLAKSVASSLGRTVGLLSVKFLALGVAASAATVGIGGLLGPTAALLSALGSLTISAGALAGGGAIAGIASAALAVGTLKMAFSGMGDALSAESIDDFNAAIKDMPASAQEAATSLRDLKEQFSGIGEEVQSSFFSNLSNLGDLTALVEPLKRSFTGLASDMGNAAAGLVDFVTQGAGLSAMGVLLHNATSAGASLSYAFADILKGLISVGAAASPILAEISSSISTYAAEWAQKMSDAFVDGSLQQYFRDAWQDLQLFWDKIVQVGSIVGNVFSAMSGAGAPFLGTIGQIIDALDQWTSSAAGMETMTNIFSVMTDAVGAVLPVIGTLAQGIGAIAPQISDMVQNIGPGLQTLAQGLSDALAGLAPILAPIGTAIGWLAEGLGKVMSFIAPALPLILGIAAALFLWLNPVTAIVIGIVALIAVLGQIIPIIVQFGASVLSGIGDMAKGAVQWVQDMASKIGQFFSDMWNSAVNAVSNMWNSVSNAFSNGVSTATNWVSNLLSSVGNFFSNMWSSVTSTASNMWNSVSNAFSNGVNTAINWVSSLPGRARDALGNTGSMLLDSGRALIQGFIDGIKGMIGRVADAARSAVQAARDFFPFSPAKRGPFSGHGYTTWSGRALAKDFAGGIDDAAPLAAASTSRMLAAAQSNLGAYQLGALTTSGKVGDLMAARSAGDHSINVGTIIAADERAPLREMEQMQTRARIKAGGA
ncbi:tapemeasure protein [Corynebacterium phage EmiRose]|uniref:Tapemeasure protein n=1 Tax=Corynebacterium phage EmiRose TaxID=2565372 RepID=A0A649VNV8_9CAUD|nr:tapemeasure protein [Corynebacterium phage EmiRose]QGJ94147.1 tapemeasure protein [Corynebacterium phage EmiRose]